MRFREIHLTPIAENKDESEEAKELLHKTGNISVLAKAVKYLRNLVKNKELDSQVGSEIANNKSQEITSKSSVKKSINNLNTTVESLILEDAMSLKKEAFALLDQIADEEQLFRLISFLKQNEIFDLCHAAIQANISQGVKDDLHKKLGQMIMNLKIPFEEKEKFLQKLGTGKGLWPGSDLVKNLTGNVYNKLSNDTVASKLAKPIALQLRGKMGYGPDQGPGEFLLALTGGGIDLAEKSDLVLIDGKGVEVKADSVSINAAGEKSRSGGRLYATTGYNGGTGARSYVQNALLAAGVPKEAFDKFGWNGKIKGEKYKNLNFNKAGIQNLNELLKEYTQPGSAEKVLQAIATGFYTDLPKGLANDFVKNSVQNNQIDYEKAIIEFVALGHEYYKAKEGHDYIMIFNTNTGDYAMIKDGQDMKQALSQGILKLGGGMDFFDDRSKGTPQILTGKL
jgi:hypothetical protein